MNPDATSKTSDRYRVPSAQVDDLTHPLDGRRPPIAVWIAVLLLAATTVGLLVPIVTDWNGFTAFARRLPVGAASGAMFVLSNAGLVMMIFRGANWARLLILFMYVVTVGVLATGLHWNVYSILYVAAQTIAMILLFVPPARAWFGNRDS